MKKKVVIILLLVMLFPTLLSKVEAKEDSFQTESINNKVEIRYDPNLEQYKEMFSKYFHSGYFEKRNGKMTLTLHPKLWAWSSTDKSNAWMSVYANFYKSQHWNNTKVMRDQFYCHARLIYQLVEREWNLEPWRTSMNSITCN